MAEEYFVVSLTFFLVETTLLFNSKRALEAVKVLLFLECKPRFLLQQVK